MSGTDAEATFGIGLETTDAERGASSLGNALERLDSQIVEDTQHVAAMQRALRNLKGGGAENVAQFKELKARIDAKKVSIAQAQSKYLDLGGTMKKIKQPAAEATGGIEALLQKAQSAGGPLGAMGGRLAGLKPLLAAGPWLLAAAAVVAFTVGLVAGTAALLSFGIAAANAYRNEKLMLDGLVAMPNWFGRAAGKADELQAAIGRVAANNPLARSEIAGLSEELYRSGLRGKGLELAIEGVATAQAGGGSAAKNYYQALVVGAGRSSAAIKKFADDAKARFGGIVAKKMLDLNVQMAKFRENVNSLFTGLKIEPLLKALNSVTELFSQNTATGRALKTIIEALLQPLIDGIGKAGPVAKRFFQGLVIGALDFTIGILQVRVWMKKTFGGSDILRGIDLTTIALYAGVMAFGALAAIAGVAALAMLTAATIAATPFIALAGMILIPWAMFKAFKTGVEAIGESLGSLDWKKHATNLVDGFVNGITAGVGRVVAAVTQLGVSAKEALKRVLDSHSPSKAFERITATGPQGAVVALKKGRSSVEQESARLGQTAADGFEGALGAQRLGVPSTPAPTAAATNKSTTSSETRAPVHVDLHYHATPDKTARKQVEDMRDLILSEFTGVGISIGANMQAGAP